MRPLLLPLLLLGSAASAQTPPAVLGDRYVPAPWWMREPVIASLGRVRTELPANRARFSATFSAVERDAAAATGAAARQVAALDTVLRAIGAERARLTTTFATRALYDQYRDKDGRLIENQRADKIDRYEVAALIEIEVRDISVLERVYNAVLAAKPTSVGSVSFRLEPDNVQKRALADAAMRDAAARARAAVEAAGARLGPVKVVDPTARVCRTDILAGWPSYAGPPGLPTDVTVSASRLRDGAESYPLPPPPPPPPPPPTPAAPGTLPAFTLQPPLQSLSDEACIVFAVL
ncbi:MAG: hypothetical protein A4S12_07685 [Proteobacteria bacterium SG_bin5]|nr:MAG: hypothetical protein A4S12_07685 [Proteobacteria bacterium SG_bin5]